METNVDSLERRALAFCLAGRLTAWPDAKLGEDARTLADGLLDGDALELRLAELARSSNREAMESAYIELFENGPRRSPIHETEYGRMRGLAKGNDLADVEGFYLAFGLTRLDCGEAMADHLGAELEFYGTLLAKLAAAHERADEEGVHVMEGARHKFLEEHLGRFASAVALQPAVAEHPHYGPLLAAAAGLVETECSRLGLQPQPLDYFAGTTPEPDAVCGATVSPLPGK
jgi:nitrate reductase assembly molybdenum cofactor insertion protein NarJ